MPERSRREEMIKITAERNGNGNRRTIQKTNKTQNKAPEEISGKADKPPAGLTKMGVGTQTILSNIRELIKADPMGIKRILKEHYEGFYRHPFNT